MKNLEPSLTHKTRGTGLSKDSELTSLQRIITSIAEFETLVANNHWQRKQDHEIVDYCSQLSPDHQRLDPVDKVRVIGWASKTSTLDGITITYREGFSYDECDGESFTSGSEGQGEGWTIDGVSVIDEDGDELNADDLAYFYLTSDFGSIDYSVLEIE